MPDDPQEKDARRQRLSDMPVDLIKEREAFVRTFLKRGVELTEELIRENEALRREVEDVGKENARLRAQVASDDAIRELLRTVDALEREKTALLDRSNELEQNRERHEWQQAAVEHELNDLANLYIASFQLHATLSPRRVLRHLSDMLNQFVGAETFAIYVLDGEGRHAVPIASERPGVEHLSPIAVGEGPVGDACITGVPHIKHQSPLGRGTAEDPIAVIPLMAEDRPVGAIAIHALLEQKKGWASVDEELFKLLGAHGGTALIAANLFHAVSSPASALAGLPDNV